MISVASSFVTICCISHLENIHNTFTLYNICIGVRLTSLLDSQPKEQLDKYSDYLYNAHRILNTVIKLSSPCRSSPAFNVYIGGSVVG